MPRPVPITRLFALAATLVLAPPLAAQAVEGKLVEEGSRAPVARALMSLVDGAGRAVATAQTRADGGFTLAAPAPGTYRVRAERVGRAATVSQPLALAAGELRPLRMEARGEAVMLEGIVAAAGERGCSVRPDRDARVATVWDEARKALEGAEWSRRHEARLFTVRTFSRDLEPRTLTVRQEKTQTARTRLPTPFRSVPAERLAEGGYVQREGRDNLFFAPDAEVLLSDAFLDTHCFRLEAGPRGQGRVGLAFEPVRGRHLPDVRGVLWLDAATAELRHVDYVYTEIGPRADNVEWGGRIDFARLPDGAWFVRRWAIRMPEMGITRNDGGSLMQARGGSMRLVAVKEDGAEVAAVDAVDGEVVMAARAPEGGAVIGFARDSASGAALAGARVFLGGTAYQARSGADGAFRVEGVPEGRYLVEWEHPRADSLDIVLHPVEVEVTAGSDSPVQLAMGRRSPAPPRPAAAAAETVRDSAIALAPLEVTAEVSRRRLTAYGFYDRSRVSGGVFMTTDDFVKRRGARLLDRIQGLRGVYARPVGGGGWAFYQYQKGRRCFVPLWINGRRGAVSELQRIPPEDVEGIEVYSGDEVPMRFAPVGLLEGRAPCGAVVVWTKTEI